MRHAFPILCLLCLPSCHLLHSFLVSAGVAAENPSIENLTSEIDDALIGGILTAVGLGGPAAWLVARRRRNRRRQATTVAPPPIVDPGPTSATTEQGEIPDDV